jgi:N-acetylglutamate synthase-like GNAT family acetyltransferase
MIEIKTPKTREDFKAYYDLRYKVLREPWGLPKGTEKDDYEPLAFHFMAIDTKTGELVGCARLYEREDGAAWYSHLAVESDRQKSGIGKQLTHHIESVAREKGYKVIGCLSRLNTTKYFEKSGYKINGMPTHYFGTTQVVWMEKPLS